MITKPSAQDITWFLDLFANNQINLNPPYQRRSVWTRKDRQFFLDTIFRGYPSPAVFIHKEVSDAGVVKFHVVDGKQRLETIRMFNDGELRMSQEYGDARLDGKKWPEIADRELKNAFWNYQLPVEFITNFNEGQINGIFDRLNRNSRKLQPQELRHAKYEGEFAKFVESEAESDQWKMLGLSTEGRSRRMRDVQFLSEIFLVVIRGSVQGFSQASLDDVYAELDDPVGEDREAEYADYVEQYKRARDFLVSLEEAGHAVTQHGRHLRDLYSLWCAAALSEAVRSKDLGALSTLYGNFMQKVHALAQIRKADPPGEEAPLFAGLPVEASNRIKLYYENGTGASTDMQQRTLRHQALLGALTT